MRPLLPSDLDAAVRALLAVPPSQRPARARWLLDKANAADRYRLRQNRPHPDYGTGTLLSLVALVERAPLPDYCDAGYCACLAVFLDVVLAQQADSAADITHQAFNLANRPYLG